MSRRALRRTLYAALGLAFLLRHDLWWWNASRPLLGLPIGLAYHLLFCIAVSVLMALIVRFAWPAVES